MPYLEKLGFHLVGYGCTTCIGNSGPLPEEVSAAVNENDLGVVSVLSGNRNFEGRINPDVKMNYLASPPLVVAYALAGTMDWDPQTEPIGVDESRQPTCSCRHLARRRRRGARGRGVDHQEMFTQRLRRRLRRRRALARRCPPPRATPSTGTPSRPTSASPRTSRACRASRRRSADITGARVLAKLGDSVTTDHISPAGSIKADSPAGGYLAEHGVDRKDFNSYGSRRGNHEVMIRGTFANIRLRNQLLDGVEGGFTRDFTRRRRADDDLRRRRSTTQAAGMPLVVLAGKEYGSGSSRDWAAKGTGCSGVKAVIAESYERIHRSNLIGMGVLPLQFPAGRERRVARARRHRDVRRHRHHGAQRRVHAAHGDGEAHRGVGRAGRVRRRGPHRHPR